VPGLSLIGFSQPLSYSGSEAFLDLLGFLVQNPYMFVHSDEFLPNNLGTRPSLQLNLCSSRAMAGTSAGRELKDRCCASRLSLSIGSKRPKILSKHSMRPVMIESRAGAGLFEPVGLLLRCLTKKLILWLGDRGAGPRECDQASRVLSVSTLRAVSWDSLSCPSPSGVSSDRYSMASGTLGSEGISVVA